MDIKTVNARDAGRVIVPEIIRFRDTPILDIVRSKRSNNIPEGAIMVPSFASTEEVDYYGTRVTSAAMDAAWPRYMSVRAKVGDGYVNQGNLRYMHDKHRTAGFCRSYQRLEKGILAYDIIPKSKQDVQQEILDGVLTGTSIGFNPIEWRMAQEADEEIIEFLLITLAERSVVDAPATPGCSFQDLAARARYALGENHSWSIGFEQRDKDADAQAVQDDDGDQVVENKMFERANGYLWFTSRPESDFVEGSLRYGKEGLDGIVVRGGMLKSKGDYYSPNAVQKIGFNERNGDGWTEEEASLFISAFGFYWSGSEDVALEQMPISRARGLMQKMFGRNRLEKDRALAAVSGVSVKEDAADGVQADKVLVPAGDQENLKGDDMEEARLIELLELQRTKIKEDIAAGVKPVSDRIDAIEAERKREKETAETAMRELERQKEEARAREAEARRVEDEKAAELKRGKDQDKPRPGLGEIPASAPKPDGRKLDLPDLEDGLGVIHSSDGSMANIRDVFDGGKRSKR